MMALESVFSTPPPVVGARYKDETMKHGEKESNDDAMKRNNGDVQHREEGELEEGEIIEEGGDADGDDAYNAQEDQGVFKKKKKKRKKRKRDYSPTNAEGSAENAIGKKKRARYVDHDSAMDAEKDWSAQGGVRSTGNSRRNYAFDCRDSPPMFARSRSPQDLYDSPYNSTGEEQLDEGLGPNEVDRSAPDAREVFHEKSRERKSSKEMKRIRNMKKKEMRRRPICKFFLDGKCAKGSDCSFLHDGSPPKKTDLCKFYLNGFCAKGEGCLYMHEEFPCKFFHTGAKCYAGDNCKFSHSPLNENTKRILDSCLDSPNRDEDFGGGPPLGKGHRPSLLGSPPAHIKEIAVQEARKKIIPSLFDIQVKPPGMPAGHQQQQQQQMRPNFYLDQGPGGGGGVGGSGSPARPPLLPMPSGFPSQRFGFEHMQKPPMHIANPDMDMNMNMNARHHHQANNMMDPDAARCVTPINNRGGVSDDDGWESDRCDKQAGFVRVETTDGSPMWVQQDDDEPSDIYHIERARSDEEDNSLTIDERCQQEPKDAKEGNEKETAATDKWDSSSDSGTEEDSHKPQPEIAIPLHLPKKQRELFRRIQQQQREANSVQPEGDGKKKEEVEKEENKEDDEKEDADEEPRKAGDTWYSSDEEDDDNDVPLAAVLKKLQQEPVEKASEQSQQVPKAIVPAEGNSATFDIAKMLQAIRNKGRQESASASASLPATNDPRAAKPERRDPRTMRGSRDPRLGRAPPTSVAPVNTPAVAAVAPVAETTAKSPDQQKCITAFHPMAYKLQAVAATHANYTSLQSLCSDPKFQNDPRLRARNRPSNSSVSNGNNPASAKVTRQTCGGGVKVPASRTSSRSSSATKDSGESDGEAAKRPLEPISSPPLHASFGNSADTAPTSLINLVPLPVPIPPPLPPLLISLSTVPGPCPEPVTVANPEKRKLVVKKSPRIKKIVVGKDSEKRVSELPRSVLELRKSLSYESPLAFSDRTENPALSYNRKPFAAEVPVAVVEVAASKAIDAVLDEPKDSAAATEQDADDLDSEGNKSLKDMFQTKDPTASPFC